MVAFPDGRHRVKDKTLDLRVGDDVDPIVRDMEQRQIFKHRSLGLLIQSQSLFHLWFFDTVARAPIPFPLQL